MKRRELLSQRLLKKAYSGLHKKLESSTTRKTFSQSWKHYLVFIEKNSSLESPITFSFSGVTLTNNVLSVSDIIINGVITPVDVSTRFDSELDGFFFYLFFELWSYNEQSMSFHFDDKYVGLRLNMAV